MKTSKVVFIEDLHQYWLGDLQLFGTSGLYGKHIKNVYADIPAHILQKAAERGTRIHDECRQVDLFGVATSPESKNYQKLMIENGIEPFETEYLVSDEKHFATKIDKLDRELNLYDIKTTYVLDQESLSWQLSISARLFEIQNPTLKVKKLFGIWLRDDKSKLVEVPRISDAIIDDLLDCEVTGRTFIVPEQTLPANVDQALQKLTDLESLISVAEAEMRSTKEQMETIKEFLKNQMSINNVKKWETDNIVVTYVAPTTRKSIDSKRLKEEQPDIYSQFIKTSQIKESIRIKIK